MNEVIETFEAEGEVGAALVFRKRMDFIDDHPANGAEGGEPPRLAEQDAEAFGRGEKNVGRNPELLLALVAGGVAGAEADSNGRFSAVDGGERRVEVFLQVVTERAQRRNVESVDAGFEGAVGFEEGEFVQDRKKGGERFSGAGGRNDEDVFPGFNLRPGSKLGGGGFREFLREPICHYRMLQREHAVELTCDGGSRANGCRWRT